MRLQQFLAFIRNLSLSFVDINYIRNVDMFDNILCFDLTLRFNFIATGVIIPCSMLSHILLSA